jgi:sugar transferase (PEP-CTERM system associated)
MLSVRSKAYTLAVVESGAVFLSLLGGELGRWRALPATTWLDGALLVTEVAILTLCFVIPLYYHDAYNLRVVKSFGEFCARLPSSLGISFVLVAIFYKCFPTLAWGGRPFFASLLCSLLVAGVLLFLRGVFYALLKSRFFVERVLILGTGLLAGKIAEEIAAASHLGYTILGFVNDRQDGPADASSRFSYPLAGPLEQLAELIARLHPDRIIVALSERRGRLPLQDLLNARMRGVIVEEGVGVHEQLSGKLAIESLTPSYLIFSRDFEVSKWQMVIRRIISLTVALIGLMLTAPLMALIALAIKCDSKGPVFFIQERAGRDGRLFRLVKFRTMRPLSPEEETQSVWQRDDSVRVTWVGKWLRKLRLDELPQFINVIRGDMDLVGPRPEMALNIQTMIEQIPYYYLRMAVRPGITGWAQVKHGYSVSQEDVTEKMRYDLYYVKHVSLWFDLRILIDTVKIVLLGRGSEVRTLPTAESQQEKKSTSEPNRQSFHSHPVISSLSEKS